MNVEQKPPYVRRGVTQLMYVGDDDAVEKATGSDFARIAKIVGGAALVLWALGEISSPRSR